MFKWIHHILEPHCPHCSDERENERVCKSCEILTKQLEIVNYERKQLLESIIRPQAVPEQTRYEASQEVKPRAIPWAVRRQMLEAEDRKQAALMNAERVKAARLQEAKVKNDPMSKPIEESSRTVEELEQELGITEQETEGVS